jgi:hypothetical protein
MPRPLECSLCKEIETVRHLFFDCIVSSLLWADGNEIFHVLITDSNASVSYLQVMKTLK